MATNSAAVARLRRTGLLMVWAGELWNLVEAGVALWSGVASDSVALLAFGFDSFIELFAGAVLIRHLSREWGGAEENQEAERRAHRLIGVTFFLLSVFIVAQPAATLTGVLPQPRESAVDIALVVVSARSCLRSTAARRGSPVGCDRQLCAPRQ